MHKFVIEKGTPEYTRHIQGALKARPRKKTHKKHLNTLQDLTRSAKSNKNIEPSLMHISLQIYVFNKSKEQREVCTH